MAKQDGLDYTFTTSDAIIQEMVDSIWTDYEKSKTTPTLISMAKRNHNRALLGASSEDVTPSMFGYADDWEPSTKEEAA